MLHVGIAELQDAAGIDRIREKLHSGQYALTLHAIEEMAEEKFEEEDKAVVSGRIVRRQTDRLRRRKYTVEGLARDEKYLRAVCRFQIPGPRWWLLRYTMLPTSLEYAKLDPIVRESACREGF